MTFDDGAVYEIEAKTRDLLAVEKQGYDITEGQPIAIMYAVALACLQRMQRAGEIPADIDLPKSLDDLAEVADVEGKDQGSPE